MTRSIEEDIEALKAADDDLKKSKKFVLSIMREGSIYLWDYIDDSLKNDEGFMLAAINNEYTYLLEYAGDSLKNNKDFMSTVIGKKYFPLLKYAGNSLKADKKFILAALKKDDFALTYADNSLKTNRDIIRAAIQKRCSANRWTNEEMENIKMDHFHELLDTTGKSSPLPELLTKSHLKKLESGKILKVITTDIGMPRDIPIMIDRIGDLLIEHSNDSGKDIFCILKLRKTKSEI